jgi:hypothetical protein
VTVTVTVQEPSAPSLDYQGGDISEYLIAAATQDTSIYTHIEDYDEAHNGFHETSDVYVATSSTGGQMSGDPVDGYGDDHAGGVVGVCRLGMPAYLNEKQALIVKDASVMAKATAAVKILC